MVFPLAAMGEVASPEPAAATVIPPFTSPALEAYAGAVLVPTARASKFQVARVWFERQPVGEAITVSVSELAFPVPPLVELTLPLVFVPVEVAVTLTVTTQVPPAGIVPSVKEIEPAPTTGANVGEPHPLVETPVGLATVMAAGKVSLNTASV